jgi:hypothetical protein
MLIYNPLKEPQAFLKYPERTFSSDLRDHFLLTFPRQCSEVKIYNYALVRRCVKSFWNFKFQTVKIIVV